jgi:hypothetical protein
VRDDPDVAIKLERLLSGHNFALLKVLAKPRRWDGEEPEGLKPRRALKIERGMYMGTSIRIKNFRPPTHRAPASLLPAAGCRTQRLRAAEAVGPLLGRAESHARSETCAFPCKFIDTVTIPLNIRPSPSNRLGYPVPAGSGKAVRSCFA